VQPVRRHAAHRAVYLAYRAGAALAQLLPFAVAEWLARVAGLAAARLMPGRRAMVARHQQRAAGRPLDDREVQERVRGTFGSYARYWLEIFRLPVEVRDGNVSPYFDLVGYEHIEASVAKGRGTILALPHLGGWEWAGAWMAGQGHRLLAVVEPIEPPELFDWFADQRNAIGLEIVPLGPDVASRVTRALRDNEIVCLLCDRDLTGDGIEVEFFGECTTLPAGPATLALRTGASLLPVATYFGPGREHHARVCAPVPIERGGRLRDDITRITQALAREFEVLIREAPQQWHLLQPNWPSDRAAAS
jgi:KDO2-lipid IV(A) lauroyltransferase